MWQFGLPAEKRKVARRRCEGRHRRMPPKQHIRYWILTPVAPFVNFAAPREAQHVQIRSLVRGARVREAMVPRFRGLDPEMSLRGAVDELLADHQQDFPVMEQGQVTGVLHRVDLFAALAQGRFDDTVRDVMTRDCQFVDESMPLDQAFALMQQTGHSMLPVLRDHCLVGVLTSDNIEEWLVVESRTLGSASRCHPATNPSAFLKDAVSY
jgi:predicted transcriptional regulator